MIQDLKLVIKLLTIKEGVRNKVKIIPLQALSYINIKRN